MKKVQAVILDLSGTVVDYGASQTIASLQSEGLKIGFTTSYSIDTDCWILEPIKNRGIKTDVCFTASHAP